jgi:hypothetical protein
MCEDMTLDVALTIQVSSEVVESTGEKTPFLAALRNSDVDPTWPVLGDVVDLRGCIETFYFKRRVLDHRNIGDVGHIAVAVGGKNVVDVLSPANGLWIADSEFSDAAKQAMGLVRPELFASGQWQQFQSAFHALAVYDSVAKYQEAKRGETWLSKVPLDEAFDPQSDDSWSKKIADYLNSYVELVKLADANFDQFTQFIARFPFSVSVWNTENPLRLAGLLVSPFHPLRLAWLSSALHTLRSATLPKSIKEVVMGSISGWQFPMSSPTPVGGGTLLAQPIDDGPESVFVGWSMLLPVSSDAPRLIVSPSSAVGHTLPALAASGLTAVAADEALYNYFALNPFVSTVVVDLAATTASTRLAAVDEGIIQALKDWRNSRAELGLSLGGIKVMDSKLRTGEAPAAAKTLGEVQSQKIGAFSWRRYEPNREPSSEPNVRVLNDSGMSFIAVNPGEGCGVIAPNLLRRLDIAEWDQHAKAVRISPSLLTDSGGGTILEQTYRAALCICESRPIRGPRLGDRVEVRASIALQKRADWQIVGDAGVPPVALSEMFAATRSGYQQMLWEWNAPMFGARRKLSTGQVAQRPYVVVAESNPLFLKRLEVLLNNLLQPNGAGDLIQSTRNRILSTLGARGIGVSALYADNTLGSPQTGAIGFWLAYELIDAVSFDDWVILQVPLDKVQALLDRLGKLRSADLGTQRADVALIALSRQDVRFIPVEVKCTGIKKPHGDFENPLTAANSNLARGIAQARTAKTKFDAVAKSFDDDRIADVASNTALLRTALLSLMDVGTRLSRGPLVDQGTRKLLTDSLERISNMSVKDLAIRVETPVVLSFEAQTKGTQERITKTLGTQEVLVYQADPRSVARDVLSGKGPTIDLVRELFLGVLGQPAALKVTQTDGSSNDGPDTSGSTPSAGPHPSSGPSSGGPNHDQTASAVASKDDEVESARVMSSSVAAGSGADVAEPTGVEAKDGAQQYDSEDVAESGTVRTTDVDRGIVFEVGRDLDYHEIVEFWPGNTRLANMNIGVFGEPGAGKTQLCLALLCRLHQLSLATQGEPIRGLILDPKDDYGSDEMKAFQETIGARVLQPVRLPIDVIGITPGMDDLQVVQRVQPFVDLLSEVMGKGIGLVQRQYLIDAILALIKVVNRSPTIREIRDAYTQAHNKPDTVSALLNDFVNNQVFVDDHSQFTPFNEIISSQVLILNLKPLQQIPNVFKQVMAIMVSQYFGAMLNMKKPPFRKGAEDVSLRELQSVLLVDEANTIMRLRFQQLEDILLQGRGFGISVILCSQFPDHFVNNELDYVGQLRTWFMHRVGNITKQQLRSFGVTADVESVRDRILGLGISESYFKDGLGKSRFIREYPYHEISR